MKKYVRDSDVLDREKGALLLLSAIRKEELSYSEAADILGMSRLDLIDYYGQLGIPYIDYEPDEIDEDARNVLKNLKKTGKCL